MTEGNDISTRIRAWMEGRMSDEDRAAFEAERRENPELDSEVKLALLLHAGLAQEAYEQQRQTLRDLIKQDPQSAQEATVVSIARSRRLWTYLAVAASLLILAGMLWTLVLKPSPGISADELFAHYYEAPAAPEQMGSANDADSLLRLGHAAYNKKSFEKAQSLYQQALTQGLDSGGYPGSTLALPPLKLATIRCPRRPAPESPRFQSRTDLPTGIWPCWRFARATARRRKGCPAGRSPVPISIFIRKKRRSC
ncbi:MAG: hypothetical protein R3B47_16785 [Bacteroidia bacterium]